MKGRRGWFTTALIVGLIVLVALLLRFYRLNGQSLWADEGNSAALALRDLPTITRDAALDIHPPLYYYLLHFWVLVFGNSEIALRSLSALMGTALVLVSYLLGRALFNRRVAVICCLLSAISPFQIHYSQETRMYVAAALWAALAIYFFLRWMKSLGGEDIQSKVSTGGGGGWAPSVVFPALYVLFTTAALYSHYFAFTIPLVTNVAYGLGMIFHRPLRRAKAIGGWVTAQVIIICLYYPWLKLAGGQLASWPAISEPFSLGFLVQELLRVFSLGLSVEAGMTPVLLVLGLLLLLGALPWRVWFAWHKRASPRLSLDATNSRLWPSPALSLSTSLGHVSSFTEPSSIRPQAAAVGHTRFPPSAGERRRGRMARRHVLLGSGRGTLLVGV